MGDRIQPRVLLLELDSLCLDLVRNNLDSMPTLRRLIEGGGELVETDSTADVASASVWPTFTTGNLPGVHGHYFPFQWHGEKMRFYRPYLGQWQGQLDFEPFWYNLARKGIDVVAFDAVQCVPSPDSPCLELHDWSAQSSGTAHTTDPALLGEIRRRFGKRPIRSEVPVSKSRRLSSSLQADILNSMKRKSDAIIWLGQHRPWRFYLASIQDVHRAGHNLWHDDGAFASDVDPTALLQVYQAMDGEVSRILDALVDNETFVLLFTLNGMATNRAQNHFLPQVLERLNRLYLTGQTLHGVSSQRSGLVARLRDRVPAGIQYAAAKMLGEKVQDWVVNRELTGSLDWAQTPSFAVATGGEGLVRLNLKGRERRGMLVPGKEQVEYLDWLEQRLLEIRVRGSGERLVSEVLDVHELYPGKRDHLLPDIAIQWAPSKPATEIESPAIGTVRQNLKTGRGGNHTGESFAIIPAEVAGTGVATDLRHITDYANLASELLNL